MSSKALCCPDSLKGVLAASEAAGALVAGFGRAGVAAERLPLADGGEGTMVALHAALGGEWHEADVEDPLGRHVDARFLVLPDGRGVVESAEAIGLWRLEPGERDPMRASSRGLGELILAAAGAGARELVVSLGGSATVDGGLGLREVLGRLPVPVTVACDVTNPLLGDRGAARVFGPQKGATPEQVERLENRLASMEELRPVAEIPGSGAAGGLGAALAALGARLVPGIELVLDAVRFDERLADAALAVTGEGSVDLSSAEGKAPAGVAAACARRGVPCVVFGGTVAREAVAPLHELGATSVLALSGSPERARDDLAALGEAVGRLLLALRLQCSTGPRPNT
jgi:glycerate kinase